MYLAGEPIDALEVGDYTVSKKYGLKCPFCHEAVFFKKGFEQIRKTKISVAACFSHYSTGLMAKECELRSSRPEGVAAVEKLAVEARNQRLRLYNSRFLEMVEDACRIKLTEVSRVLNHLDGGMFTKSNLKPMVQSVAEHMQNDKTLEIIKSWQACIESKANDEEERLQQWNPEEYESVFYYKLVSEMVGFLSTKTGEHARRGLIKAFYATVFCSAKLEDSAALNGNLLTDLVDISALNKDKILTLMESKISLNVYEWIIAVLIGGDWGVTLRKHLDVINKT